MHLFPLPPKTKSYVYRYFDLSMSDTFEMRCLEYFQPFKVCLCCPRMKTIQKLHGKEYYGKHAILKISAPKQTYL